MRLPQVTITDTPPPGWFVLDVLRQSGRRVHWAALMIDVPADGHCSGQQPATASVWVHVPGKHRTWQAAWAAFEDWRQTRHQGRARAP